MSSFFLFLFISSSSLYPNSSLPSYLLFLNYVRHLQFALFSSSSPFHFYLLPLSLSLLFSSFFLVLIPLLLSLLSYYCPLLFSIPSSIPLPPSVFHPMPLYPYLPILFLPISLFLHFGFLLSSTQAASIHNTILFFTLLSLSLLLPISYPSILPSFFLLTSCFYP